LNVAVDAHVFVEDKAAHVLHHYGLGTCATAGTVCIVQLRENRSSLIQGLLSRRGCLLRLLFLLLGGLDQLGKRPDEQVDRGARRAGNGGAG
jgi:hypothetical protein